MDMEALALSVDQYGVPRKGFIQADKIRAREAKNHTKRAVNLLSKKHGSTPGKLSEVLFSFSVKAQIFGVVALLLLTATIVFLVGENQHLTMVAEQTAIGVDDQKQQELVVIQAEIAVLQNDVERKKRNVSRTAEQTLSDTLSGLRQGLNIKNEYASVQIVDDQSLSLSNPLAGQVVTTRKPEMDRVWGRTPRMIDSKSGF